ncbi:MAG: PAS domain S-box protein [Rhodocyclaceae bacterium]|nr:PAS domain S-box protein [Rhodocyclaceae bacterium]
MKSILRDGYHSLRLLGYVVVALFLGIAALMGWRSLSNIEEDRKLTLSSEVSNGMVAVRALEEHATQTFEDAIRTLDRVALRVSADKAASRGDIKRLRALIGAQDLEESKHLKALQFVALDGTSWITSPDYPAHQADISERQHIRFLLDNPDQLDAIVGRPYASRYDSQLVVPVARKLFGPDHKPIGIVSVDVRLAYFGELYSRVAKDNNACVALISEDGFVIVRSPFEARYIDREIADSPVLASLTRGDAEGYFFDEAFLDDELPRYYSYRKTAGLKMIALYGRDTESIYASWQDRRSTHLTFAAARGVMLILLIITISVFVRRLRTARDDLRDSQAKFFGLFEHSPLPMILIRYPDNVIMEVNAAWATQLGYARSAVIGRDTTTLNIWVDLEHRKQLISRLLKDSFLPPHDVFLRHQDGRTLTFELAASEFETGRERLFVFTLYEVTLERQREQEILELNQQLESRVTSRTAKLASANEELTRALDSVRAMQGELIRSEKMAALGSLVAGVAHELNTPIGNSLTVATTIEDHAANFARTKDAGQLTKRQLDTFIASISEGSSILTRTLTRAAELVSSFKQVAVDQTSDVRRRFPLRTTLTELATTLEPVCRKTPFRFKLGDIDEVQMDSYPGALAQVINNFLNNSLLHAFEGREHGTMTLTGKQLDEKYVELIFADDGVGIPHENLTKVFDPFFTTKLGAGGSGLGMHIVYNVITGLLGGSIKLASTPGHGVTITVRLPIVAPRTPVAEPERNKPSGAGSR